MPTTVPPAQRNKASGFKASSKKGNQASSQIDMYHSYWAPTRRTTSTARCTATRCIGYARDYWWAYRFLFMMANRALRAPGDPAGAGLPPRGQHAGGRRDAGDAAQLGDRARSGGAPAVQRRRRGAVNNGDSGWTRRPPQREWDFKFMETPWEALTVFDDRFNYLNMMKLRSVWVPDLAFIGNGSRWQHGLATSRSRWPRC
jgi:hypothetical protein